MKLSPTDLSKIQEDWLKYMAENNLTDEEKAMVREVTARVECAADRRGGP